jgi:hypothetical protein
MKEFLLRNKACSKTQSKPLMSHSSSLNAAPGYEVGDRMICFLLCLLVLCLTTLFQSNGWMISEWRIRKDVEGDDRGLIFKILSQHLPRGPEKDHEQPHSGWPVSGTSRM